MSGDPDSLKKEPVGGSTVSRVLALDPGVKCGWALCRLSSDPKAGQPNLVWSGTQTFDLRRGESPGMRLLRFRHWLGEVGAEMSPGDLVLYEIAHHRGGYTTELLLQIIGELIAWAAGRGCEHKGVHSRTLKKAVGGSGNADKDTMRAAVRAAGPEASDHEVDALALLVWYHAGMPEPQTRQPRVKASHGDQINPK